MPAEEQGAGTEGEGVPAEEQGAGTEGEEVPAKEQGAGTEGEEVPAEEQGGTAGEGAGESRSFVSCYSSGVKQERVIQGGTFLPLHLGVCVRSSDGGNAP